LIKINIRKLKGDMEEEEGRERRIKVEGRGRAPK
jgi:hypothetical protein